MSVTGDLKSYINRGKNNESNFKQLCLRGYKQFKTLEISSKIHNDCGPDSHNTLCVALCLIWEFLSHHRTVTATAHCTASRPRTCKEDGPLSETSWQTHWQTGELHASLGPKGNQKSLSCTELGLLKLWDTNPNIFTWGSSVSSTACVPQPNGQHWYTPYLF